uniref:BAG family molecular chaperone regulator 2 n=1 Tax=Anthurium amnicola TaxID=1678845 RepID=A0A1D1Z574_9ARAE
MVKLRSRKLFKNSSKHGSVRSGGGVGVGGDIKWELRPGGMLVQKREDGVGAGGEVITVRVCAGSQWHDVSIDATSTFGELKVVLSMVTGMEARAQRLLFRGKEREDTDHLHMVGVGEMDKVLLLEDPATKERKLHALRKTHQVMGTPLPTIKV